MGPTLVRPGECAQSWAESAEIPGDGGWVKNLEEGLLILSKNFHNCQDNIDMQLWCEF
jgi:hypothetical protein